MAAYSARRTLTGTGQYLQIRVPDPKRAWAVLVNVEGTYVGQLQVESADDADGLFNTDLMDEDSGVAVDGTYSAQLEANAEGLHAALMAAGEDEVRVYFSAYTSGSAEVTLSLVPGSV